MTKGEEIINIYFSTLAVECIYCVSYIIRVIAVLATSVLYHLLSCNLILFMDYHGTSVYTFYGILQSRSFSISSVHLNFILQFVMCKMDCYPYLM